MRKISFKNSSTLLVPLKNRAKDFLRISPAPRYKELKKFKIKKISTVVAEEALNNNVDGVEKNVLSAAENSTVVAANVAEVVKTQASWSTAHFSVSIAPTRFADGHFHIGFVSTKKTVSKLAVLRNRSKRILRSLVNENIERDNLEFKKFDWVFVAKNSILLAAREDLVKDFHWATKHVVKKFNETPEETAAREAKRNS